MTQKIIYFTAGSVPTGSEIADIDALNALTPPPYSVKVSNGTVDPDLGMRENPDSEGPDLIAILMDCDFVAGTIPTEYEEFPVFDPDHPPSGLPDDQAIVEDGQVIEVDGGTVTISVTDGLVSAEFTPE